MKVNIEEVTERRAINLAVLFLTRKDDLIIHEEVNYGEDTVFDLVVTLVDDDEVRGYFAVEVKGSYDASNADALLAYARLEDSGRENMSVPVCYFYFTMSDDKGYYVWLRPPIGASPKLTGAGEGLSSFGMFSLTEARLEDIVSEVKAWYQHNRQEHLESPNGFDEKHLLRLLLAET